MTVDIQTGSPSKARLYTGYALTTLSILFFLMDAGFKFTTNPQVVEAQKQLQFPMQLTPALGVIALVCIALYAIPATTVLGAVLLTGYLGGAIAIHWRVGNPLFSHILFPIYVALFIWGGIWLRDANLRSLFPIVQGPSQPPAAKGALYTGYVLTALSALLMLFTALMKFIYVPPAGSPPPLFPPEHVHALGILEIFCVLIYLFPSTSFLGNVLLTGYLGGATAICLRGGQPVSTSLVTVYIGIVLWAGLWLRNLRVRALLPICK